MRFKHPTADRIWLWMIAISFAIGVPILVALRVQDFGAGNVILFILALILFGLYRGWPTDSTQPKP